MTLLAPKTGGLLRSLQVVVRIVLLGMNLHMQAWIALGFQK